MPEDAKMVEQELLLQVAVIIQIKLIMFSCSRNFQGALMVEANKLLKMKIAAAKVIVFNQDEELQEEYIIRRL